ncbi:MAG: NAD(+) diphosphatase [Desulfuromonadales bacterium]
MTDHETNPLNPEAINLPFNYSSIKNEFVLLSSGEDTQTADGTWVIIQSNSVILKQSHSRLELPGGRLPDWMSPQQTPVCVGIWRGKPLRAFTVSGSLRMKSPFVAATFNAADEQMDIRTLTLAGLSKQILHWEQQSRHCSRCGAETEPIASSRGKLCTSCRAEHFPHIHPCAIVLVKRGSELLLTRKAEWQSGRYSLVAGFLDVGESLEECAIREVREETGIEITNVRYVGSQNWPFPAQLMAGFTADYAGGGIVVDHSELEDARWFSVNALPTLPPSRSIARWIIDNFK